MRKFTKILLAGTGVVFAGAVAYALLKKPDSFRYPMSSKRVAQRIACSGRSVQ